MTDVAQPVAYIQVLDNTTPTLPSSVAGEVSRWMGPSVPRGCDMIHVDARMVLRDQARDTPLGGYDVKNPVAWGGIVGATTKIEDVDESFAVGVAIFLFDRKAP
jgi:hypothetical protein